MPTSWCPRPSSVEIYNRFMGGLDKADMLVSLYRTKLRSRKWYHCIVFHLVSLALINSFTVYRQIGGKGSLLEFRIEICSCLVKADKEVDSNEDMENSPRFQRSLKAKKIPDQVHNHRVNHWPIECDKPNRCKQADCTKRSCFICSKYQTYLCVLSDCFLKAHGVV